MYSPLSVLPLQLACQLLISQNSSSVNVNLSRAILPKPTTEIPSGYVMLPEIGVAYKFHDHRVKWNMARKLCLAEGGHLAVTDTYQKYRLAMDLEHTRSKHIHVGFHKLFDGAEWTNDKTGLPAIAIPWRFDSYQGENRQCTAGDKDKNGVIAVPCDGELATYVCEVSIFED